MVLPLALLSFALAQATPARDLWVTSDGEPVAADVDIVSLAPSSCPCDPTRTFRRPNVTSEGVGGCLCPAAFVQMRERLSHCKAPRVLETRRGPHVGVRRAGAIAIEARAVVAGAPRVAWVTTQKTGDLSIELSSALRPRFVVVQDRNMMPETEPVVLMMPAIVQGALLYDDGRCVPLVRDGDAFVPAVGVPKDVTAQAVFLDDKGVLTPWFWTAWSDADVEVKKAPPGEIAGTCAPKTPVYATHALVDAQVTSDDSGHFVMTLPRGPAIVTCGDKRWALEGNGWLQELPSEDALARHAADRERQRARDILEAARAKECASPRVVDASGRPVQNAEVPLQRGSITLRVLSPDGHPVARAVVWARGTFVSDGCRIDSPSSPLLYTDVDGIVRLEDVWQGRLEVLVRHEAWAYTWFQVDVPAPASTPQTSAVPVTVTLDRGAQLVGHVRDAAGAPVLGCSATARVPHDRRPYWTACHGDRFMFRGLPPGEVVVEVRAPDGAPAYRAFAQTVTLAKDVSHTVELAWPRGKTIRGIVVDARGAPLPGARVDAHPEGTQLIEGRFTLDEIQLHADAQGRFVITDVRDGRWLLSGSGRARWVTVTAGDENVRLVVDDVPP